MLNVGHFSYSHTEIGGQGKATIPLKKGHEKLYPVQRSLGGAKKFHTHNFPILYPPPTLFLMTIPSVGGKITSCLLGPRFCMGSTSGT